MFINEGVINFDESNYPEMLRHIYNPPKALYFKGNTSILNQPAISIVGTRKASEYGFAVTEKIISDFKAFNFVIVSGLAHGIDTFSHQLALDYGLPTIAVLGTGIDNIYPPQNKTLAQQILQRDGLIISEYPEESEGKPYQFPQRNRIISGLSLASIIIEAAEQSGALITAKYALEQGREIFTVPGDIFRTNSQGPLRLLQHSGAYPISSGTEIVDILKRQPQLFMYNQTKKREKVPVKEDLSLQKSKIKAEGLSQYEIQVLSCLNRTRGKSLHQISTKIKIPIQDLLVALTHLEIKKLAYQRSDVYFSTF